MLFEGVAAEPFAVDSLSFMLLFCYETILSTTACSGDDIDFYFCKAQERTMRKVK